MGSVIGRQKKSIQCVCELSKEFDHCCKRQCFDQIKNALKMKDVLYLRWLITKKHERILLQSLKQYKSEYIADIILSFLPTYKDSMLFNTKAWELNNDQQQNIIYHAYFHLNISALYKSKRQKSICSVWTDYLLSIQRKRRYYRPTKKNEMEIPTIQIVLLGDGGVGKSALVIKYVTNNFLDEYDPTIEDSYKRILELNPSEKDIDSFKIKHSETNDLNEYGEPYQYVALDILDTAGKEEFSSMRDQWIIEATFFILCFSITSQMSWDDIELYRERILRIKVEECAYEKGASHDVNNFGMMIVGTKNDLHNQRKVSSEKVLKQAKAWNIPYIETSSKEGRNVNFAFRQSVYEYWLQSQSHPNAFSLE